MNPFIPPGAPTIGAITFGPMTSGPMVPLPDTLEVKVIHGDRKPAVLIAWLAGEISEGRARELLGLDVMALRKERDKWAAIGVKFAESEPAPGA